MVAMGGEGGGGGFVGTGAALGDTDDGGVDTSRSRQPVKMATTTSKRFMCVSWSE
jgi:hypothetical protein